MIEKENNYELPKGWTLSPLKDVCEILDHLRRPINSSERNERIKNKNKSELYPYYGATGPVGLIDDFITDGEFVLIGEDAAPFFDKSKDVAYEIKGKAWVNNHAHILKSHFNNRFLRHYLNIFDYDGYVSGTTRLKLTKGFLEKIPVKVAPLPEQNRIVEKLDELLSELEKGKEQLQVALAQLKVYRQAVLKWAFEGRLTGSKNVEYYKLGDLCDNVEYGSAAKSKKEGKIPVLRMGNIQGGIFDWSDLVFTDDQQEIERYLLKKNDVLFNRTNSPELVGKTAIYRGERPAIFAGYLIRINYKKDKINPYYLNYYLNSQEAKNYGSSVKSFGVNQSNINGTKLKAYPFPYVDTIEQEKIVSEIESRLSVSDKLEETINQSLQQAEALKQSLLQKAFEGKLVPQDPNDEPAGVLLERIGRERETFFKTGKGRKTMDQKKDIKNKGHKATEPLLIDTIKEKFGNESFTFDELRPVAGLSYDDLKEELFSLLDKVGSLTMEFDQKMEAMTFKYKGG